MQKEEAQELTEKLDKEWKNIQALMVKKTPKAEAAHKPEEKPKVALWRSINKMCVFVRQLQRLIFLLFSVLSLLPLCLTGGRV